MFTKILVVEPPYIAPYNKPASMMMEPVGSKYMVRGSKIDRVEAGPKPGSTPTRVPKRHPKKQYKKFIGDSTFMIPITKSTIFILS
jgi:hypothetical protein